MNNIKHTFYSNVNDEGELQRNVRQQIKELLPYYKNERIEITVQKLRSKRSLKQNRLFWVYVTIIANELGYEKEQMKEIISYKFLKRERVDERTGEIFEYIESTTKLNKTDFADMVNSLIRWAAETLHIVLPLPDQQLTID